MQYIYFYDKDGHNLYSLKQHSTSSVISSNNFHFKLLHGHHNSHERTRNWYIHVQGLQYNAYVRLIYTDNFLYWIFCQVMMLLDDLQPCFVIQWCEVYIPHSLVYLHNYTI